VGVGVVVHAADALSLRVALLLQIAQAFGVIALDALRRHRHVAPARQGLDNHEEVGGAVPLVLVVPALEVPRSGRQARAHVRVQDDRFLVEADGGVALVEGQGVER